MLKKLIKAKLKKPRLILIILFIQGKAEIAPPLINYTYHPITSYICKCEEIWCPPYDSACSQHIYMFINADKLL